MSLTGRRGWPSGEDRAAQWSTRSRCTINTARAPKVPNQWGTMLLWWSPKWFIVAINVLSVILQKASKEFIFQMNCLSRNHLTSGGVLTVIKAERVSAGDEEFLLFHNKWNRLIVTLFRIYNNALQPQIFSGSFIKIPSHRQNVLNINTWYTL